MYNSQYYTCEQIDERLLQGYLDDYNTQTGQSLTKAQFLTKLGSIFSKEGVIDNTATQIGYYECDTAAGTAAKAITVANYALFAGGSMKVKFANKNTANNATLNINSQGAKALYYQGERASATNSWDANEVVEIYYDGTSYYANNVKGGSGSGVYDVSKEHPTSGPNSDGKFTLEYILNSSNVNELIPVNKRYPGMTIQFVSTSDNKYVQYRLNGTSFTTNVTAWEKQDAVSNFLIKIAGFLSPSDLPSWNALNVGDVAYNVESKLLRKKITHNPNSYETVPYHDGAIYSFNNELYTWSGTNLIPVGTTFELWGLLDSTAQGWVNAPIGAIIYNKSTKLLRQKLGTLSNPTYETIPYGNGIIYQCKGVLYYWDGADLIPQHLRINQDENGNYILSQADGEVYGRVSTSILGNTAIINISSQIPLEIGGLTNGAENNNAIYARTSGFIKEPFKLVTASGYKIFQDVYYTYNNGKFEYYTHATLNSDTRTILKGSPIFHRFIFVKENSQTFTTSELPNVISTWLYDNNVTIAVKCDTVSNEPTKVVSGINQLELPKCPITGINLNLLMSYANTADNVTLTYGSYTKALYFNGKAVSPNNTWENNSSISVFYRYDLDAFVAYPFNKVSSSFGNSNTASASEKLLSLLESISYNSGIIIESGTIINGTLSDNAKRVRSVNYLKAPFEVSVADNYELFWIHKYTIDALGNITWSVADELHKKELRVTDNSYIYKLLIRKEDNSDINSSEYSSIISTYSQASTSDELTELSPSQFDYYQGSLLSTTGEIYTGTGALVDKVVSSGFIKVNKTIGTTIYCNKEYSFITYKYDKNKTYIGRRNIAQNYDFVDDCDFVRVSLYNNVYGKYSGNVYVSDDDIMAFPVADAQKAGLNAKEGRLKNPFDIYSILPNVALNDKSLANGLTLDVNQTTKISQFESVINSIPGATITKTSLGYDQSGTYEMFGYEITPTNYTFTFGFCAHTHPIERIMPAGFMAVLKAISNIHDTRPTIKWLRENVRWVGIWMCNPWGYHQSEDNDYSRWNNGRYNSRGVNLVCNFDYNWDAQTAEVDHRGSSVESEAETKHIKAFFEPFLDSMGAYIDFHDFAGYWAYNSLYMPAISLHAEHEPELIESRKILERETNTLRSEVEPYGSIMASCNNWLYNGNGIPSVVTEICMKYFIERQMGDTPRIMMGANYAMASIVTLINFALSRQNDRYSNYYNKYGCCSFRSNEFALNTWNNSQIISKADELTSWTKTDEGNDVYSYTKSATGTKLKTILIAGTVNDSNIAELSILRAMQEYESCIDKSSFWALDRMHNNADVICVPVCGDVSKIAAIASLHNADHILFVDGNLSQLGNVKITVQSQDDVNEIMQNDYIYEINSADSDLTILGDGSYKILLHAGMTAPQPDRYCRFVVKWIKAILNMSACLSQDEPLTE